MTLDAFTASLDRSAASHPPSKARRIAALLPLIEEALAEGSTRAHIVTALLGVGITITPHQLSNLMARLRRQKGLAADLPATRPALESNDGANFSERVNSSVSAVDSLKAGTAIVSATTTTTTSTASASAPTYGAHDPRLLDEVMRSTPDLKAFAKLAPKATTQGKP